jgi:ABC-2 type transport system permease protein
MMRNVFTKTLYDLRWTILAFSVGLGLLSFVVLYLYPKVEVAQEEMFSGLAGETARAVLGDLDLAGTVEGYLNVQLFPFMPLFVAVFLLIVTSSAIAGEEGNKTLGVLLARPVPRWKVLTQKALAYLLGLVVILAAMAGGAVAGALVAGVVIDENRLAASILATLPYGIWLLGFGLFCSAVFRSRMVAALVATGVVVFTYMFNSLTEFVESWRVYNQAFPVYYYAWGDPLIGSLNLTHLAVLIGAGAVFYVLAIVAFQRREVLG